MGFGSCDFTVGFLVSRGGPTFFTLPVGAGGCSEGAGAEGASATCNTYLPVSSADNDQRCVSSCGKGKLITLTTCRIIENLRVFIEDGCYATDNYGDTRDF